MSKSFFNFRETVDYDSPSLPSVLDSVGKWEDFTQRIRVADYLSDKRNRRFIKMDGHQRRSAFTGVLMPESADIMDDGEWVWPGELGRYVKYNSVVLPDEFLDHILERIDQ